LGQQFVPDFKLDLVTFQHSPPEDMTLYNKAFRCPVVFNAERTTIVANYKYLELEKTTLLTKMLTPLIKRYMNWQLARHPKATQSISMVVTEVIPVILGMKGSDIQHAAGALNLHPKKLQRLLKSEGTSYSQILDNVRMNIAARILIESDISIIRLAKMLDYSSDRSFTAASKRWFGMGATEYRKHLKSKN
jgi:AraC-like DNA-binding protein